MKTLAHFLTHPINVLWLALAAALFLYLFRRHYSAKLLLTVNLCWLFLVSASPLPTWLVAKREARHPVPCEPYRPHFAPNILVLGSAHGSMPDLSATSQLSSVALARLSEGIRLYKQYPGSKLIGSGASGGSVSQGEMMMRAAVELGVPPADTLYIPHPADTRQEACGYAARFGSDRPLVLVTSALHLPRAVFWFKQSGLRPYPFPADYQVKQSPQHTRYDLWPSNQKMAISQKLLREWLGMVHARWIVGFG